MRILGNLLWFLLGGWIMGLAWGFAGALCFLSIVGVPFGVVAFRIAGFSFFPFGRTIEDRHGKSPWGSTPLAVAGNIVWVLLFGWWLALGHLSSAILCAVTVIGIPFAWQHVKLAWLSLVPFDKEIVPGNFPGK